MSTIEKDHQEILREYEAVRSRALAERDQRVQEIYQTIPEVEQLDQRIEQFGLRAMQSYLKTHEDPKEILSRAREEIEQLRIRRDALVQSHGYPANYRDPVYRCPVCQDTGYHDGRRCHCFEQKLIARAYGRSNLNELLDKQNFAHFDLERFSDQPFGTEPVSARENMRIILDHVKSELDSFSSHAAMNLLFKGHTGTGKTYLASCIAKAVLDAGFTVLYLSSYDLCQLMAEYRYRYRNAADAAENEERLSFVYSCDLLIIDDLGTEVINSVSNADLLHLINRRIQTDRSTILSTNCDLKQLQQNYSDRFLSRIMGSYRIMSFYGEDIRMKAFKNA